MRINNLHLTNFTVGQAGDAPTTGETGRREAPERPANDASFHTPSPELARWIALAHQEPDVRPEVLAKVAKNLETGVYLTPASAEQTARALNKASE